MAVPASPDNLPPEQRPGGAVIVLAILLTFFVILVALFWPFTCDDAYITFRYAKNIAAGLGPVFNPGEVVEGYSSPLWLALLLAGMRLGLDVIQWAKVLGLLCGLATLLLAYAIARRLAGARDDRAVWALFLLVPNAGLVYYTASGLETVLYAALLTAIVYCFLDTSPRAIWAGSLAALAAALARPEGLLILAGAIVWRLVATWRRGRAPALAAWLSGLAGLAACAGFLLWRQGVFGEWLPNTYYAKPPGVFGALDYLSPAAYIRQYLAETGAGLMLGLAAAVLAIRRDGEQRRDVVVAAAAAGLVVLTQVALVAHARGDWMALHRFLVPLTPVVAAWGMAGLLRLTTSRPVAMIAAALLGVVSFVHLQETLTSFRDRQYPYEIMGSISQREAGRWLRRTFPPDTLLAGKRIGAISYFSEMRMVDALGLVDRRIAHLRHDSRIPGAPQYGAMADEVLSRRPDLVLLCLDKSWPDIPLDQPAPDVAGNLRDVDGALYERLERRGYRFLSRYPQGAGELAVYRRLGSAVTAPQP